MASERIQRRIDRLLDQIEEAMDQLDWHSVRTFAQAVLRLDPENNDALGYLAAAERDPGVSEQSSTIQAIASAPPSSSPFNEPTSFANGRYEVKRFLGEGGKKKVGPRLPARPGRGLRPHQNSRISFPAPRITAFTQVLRSH